MDTPAQEMTLASMARHGCTPVAARWTGHIPSVASKQNVIPDGCVDYRLPVGMRTGVTHPGEGGNPGQKCKAMAKGHGEIDAPTLNIDGTLRDLLETASTVAFNGSQVIPPLPKFMAEDDAEAGANIAGTIVDRPDLALETRAFFDFPVVEFRRSPQSACGDAYVADRERKVS